MLCSAPLMPEEKGSEQSLGCVACGWGRWSHGTNTQLQPRRCRYLHDGCKVGHARFGGEHVGVGLGHLRDDCECCVAEGDGDVGRALRQQAVDALHEGAGRGVECERCCWVCACVVVPEAA